MLAIALSAGPVLLAMGGDALARPRRTAPGGAERAVVSQQGGREGEESQKSSEAGGPVEVFADIERGWNARNVDLILRHFGSQKVAIAVEGTGPAGGSFSRNQSYYLLKDLFRYTITRKFERTQYRKPDAEGGQSFAVFERHYQKTDDGRLFKDKVYVSLHLESNDSRERWVVDEIKSIR